MNLEARLQKLENRLGMHKLPFPYDWLIIYDSDTMTDHEIGEIQNERFARSGTRFFVVLPRKIELVCPQSDFRGRTR
jgi:hypothetical protein